MYYNRTFPSVRCVQWIINSGRDDFAELEDRQLRCRYLCSEHFKDSAFTNHLKKKLLQNNHLAIPIPFFADKTEPSNLEKSKLNNSPAAHNSISDNKIQNNNQLGNKKNISKELFNNPHNFEETLEQFNQDFQPLPDNYIKATAKTTEVTDCSLTPRKKS